MSENVIDVGDDTFEAEVMARSESVPVVVDLWAPWCGPCKTLGPILEAAVESHGGAVRLAKVNVDENRAVATQYQAQSIPAVHAVRNRATVASFLGAQPAAKVNEFVAALVPTPEELRLRALIDDGSEPSLREALKLVPGDADAVVALAELLITRGDPGGTAEALILLERVPGDARADALAARARLGSSVDASSPQTLLDELLPQVKADPDARQRFLDILSLMDPADGDVAAYRRKLTSALY